jgi:hypothetical protein
MQLAAQPVTGPQAGAGLLQQALTAQSNPAPVTDVTLSGTISVTPSIAPESGTIVLLATSGRQSKTIITVPSGTLTEIRNYSATTHTATITNANGSQNLIPEDLLSPDPAWFFPTFLMASTISSSGYVCSDVGPEPRAGTSVEHLAIWYQPSGMSGPVAWAFQHDTQQDLYLDSSSLLPVSLALKLRGNYVDTSFQHWEKSVYVPEEIRFSDYRQVQGRPIAFHIQLYIEDMLFYDIQVTSATFNSGVVIAGS